MLIGLCGAPLSGKTEVAKVLVDRFGFEILDTKAVLRQMAATLTGLEPEDFATPEGKAMLFHGVERRRIMGELMNKVEELWDDSFMVKRAVEDIRKKRPDSKIVVDALRKSQPVGFPGLVYQVISNRGVETTAEYDQFDKSRINGIIVNDGTLNALSDAVKRAFAL